MEGWQSQDECTAPLTRQPTVARGFESLTFRNINDYTTSDAGYSETAQRTKPATNT